MADEQGTLEIEEVINQVKAELNQAAAEDFGVRLTKFELQLSITRTTEAGGGFKFKIPVLGIEIGGGPSGSIARVQTHSLSLTLRPVAEIFKFGRETLGIVAALGALAKGVKAALDSQPKLGLESSVLEFSFGVKKEASGKVELVVVEANASYAQENLHKVKLYFEPDQS